MDSRMQRSSGQKLCLVQMVVFLVVVVPCMIPVVQCRLLDITREVKHIVSIHNKERMDPGLKAADMKEMIWDSSLQREAESWAGRCDYKRPSSHVGKGSNLYYSRIHSHGHHSARQVVKTSLNHWISQKRSYVYSPHCQKACLYAQMISSSSNRVGCALNLCNKVNSYRDWSDRGSLFICIYSPQQNLQSHAPYVRGPPCSRCDRQEKCVQGCLCSTNERYAEISVVEVQPHPRNIMPNHLTHEEQREIVMMTNEMRKSRHLSALSWDSYLERYCHHIINCSVDYPGPRHSYTNFHRLKGHESVGHVITEWQRNSGRMPTHEEHKCRTPFDIEQCNHFSNMMQPYVTRMACATKNCYHHSRQMVCIYDNPSERNRKTLAELRNERKHYRPVAVWLPERRHHNFHHKYRN